MTRVAIAMLLVGCTPTVPEPSITDVTPSWGYAGRDTPIRVIGTDFVPAIRAAVRECVRTGRRRSRDPASRSG